MIAMLEKISVRLGRALDGLGWGDSREWVLRPAIASALMFLLALSLAKGVWLLALCLAALLPIAGAYSIPAYLWAKRQRSIEAGLPQALYAAASRPFAPLEEIVRELSHGKGAMQQEFAKASMQVRNGIAIDTALEGMAAANDSALLKRAIGLLLQSYHTGADMGEALKETAEEISSMAEAVQARAASAAIEKYTLLLAGGIIVPIVLGTLSSMTSSLGLSGLAVLGFGSASGKELLSSAVAGSQLYIAEYALIASVFVAYQEGAIENSLLYAAVLVPASMALFMLASSGILV